MMLTRGFDSVYDSEWESKWKDLLRSKRSRSSIALTSRLLGDHFTFLIVFPGGSNEVVSLAAYAINVEDITNRRKGAILQVLLQKCAAGRASKRIWELPVVSAIISYHWQHWAQSFLLVSFGFFMAWIVSYVSFLICYIVPNGHQSN